MRQGLSLDLGFSAPHPGPKLGRGPGRDRDLRERKAGRGAAPGPMIGGRMLTLGIAIALVVAAAAFAAWLVRAMLRHRCPSCAQRAEEGMLIPVIPGARWWCLACGEVFTPEQTRRAEDGAPERKEGEEGPLGPEPPRLDL